MVVELNLTKLTRRVVLAVAAFAGCALLVAVIISRFVIGTLADDRLAVTRETLRVPVGYFPNSARLNGRLASAELAESDRDLATAEFLARRAVNLSPYDYRFRLTLASIEEAKGDRLEADQSLEAARQLAPSHWETHYRLGNLRIREGRLTEALDDLRAAVAANPDLLFGTLDLVWRASRGNVSAVEAVSGSDPRARLVLAQFLLKQSKPSEAASVFSSVDRSDRIASVPESSAVLNSLIAVGRFEIARDLWFEIVGGDRPPALIWNGGFESDISKSFPQFDWSLNRSDYARLALDADVAHSGSRSLRLEFTGRDTTVLDNEIKQLVLVRPRARYTLECYVRTNDLKTPEGPRLVVTDTASKWIAASEPVAQGSADWRQLAVEFEAPEGAGSAAAVLVSIKRKPKFSYDDPTRGVVWFDDFAMKEHSN
jgi:tetratricopeptide (TPR) repeat protein